MGAAAQEVMGTASQSNQEQVFLVRSRRSLGSREEGHWREPCFLLDGLPGMKLWGRS